MSENKNGTTPEEKKVGFVTKVKEGVKALPEKHPKITKVGKVAVTVGKTAVKAAFVAGAGTVAALTILDKTKGKQYATLPSITDHPEIELPKVDPNEVFKEAAEASGLEVKEF